MGNGKTKKLLGLWAEWGRPNVSGRSIHEVTATDCYFPLPLKMDPLVQLEPGPSLCPLERLN